MKLSKLCWVFLLDIAGAVTAPRAENVASPCAAVSKRYSASGSGSYFSDT